MIKLITPKFSSLLTKIMLGIILTTALFLRLYKIDNSTWMQSGYDESRDMLVAKHIIVYEENIIRGPLASGGMNWLKNSPIYYYFVAIIWFFTREPVVFMYVWAIIFTIPVLLAYLIGKKVKDSLTGLILASIFAVNQQMIYSSRELLQAHLLLIFSTAFIWSFISYLKNKKNNKYLLLSVVFLFSPLHFHYGVIIALPIASLLIVYHVFKNWQKNKDQVLSKIFIPSTIIFLILWSWILLTYRSFPFDQIYFFTRNFSKQYKPTALQQIQNTALKLTQMIWGNYQSVIISGFFLIILFFIAKKILTNKKNKEIFIFIIAMCSSMFLFVFYRHYVAETYLLFIFPFFLILLALILRLLIENKPTIGWVFTGLSIFFLLNASLKNILQNLPPISYHDQQKELAQVIYDDYTSKSLLNVQKTPDLLISWYTTTGNMPFDGWGSSGIWYYLENNFNQKLVTNTNYGLNHTPINKYPQTVYMICDHRLESNLVQIECLDRFKKSYLIFEDSISQIWTGENLSVWRAELKTGKSYQTINVVHQDLLNN